jgi:hypothetical protein
MGFNIMVNKNNTEQDYLLNLVERLVDNIQDTNKTNTDMLNSINNSLIKFGDTTSEIREINDKIKKVDTETVKNELTKISTNSKVLVAVISIILTFSMIILGLYQYKLVNEISGKISTNISVILDQKIDLIEKDIVILEGRKK